MASFSDSPQYYEDSPWHRDGFGFGDADCDDDMDNLPSGDSGASQGSEGASPVPLLMGWSREGSEGDAALSLLAKGVDAFTELMRVPSNGGGFLCDLLLSPSDVKGVFSDGDCTDCVPTVFKIPVARSEPTSFPLAAPRTLVVPALPKAGTGGGSGGGSIGGFRFEAQSVGAGYIARVAPAAGALTMVPLPPALLPPAAAAAPKHVARARARAGGGACDACDTDGDLLASLRLAVAASFYVPSLPSPADRARQAACKQQRLDARRKLTAKQLRWKAAAAATAAETAAKPTKYPQRRQAAGTRKRLSGKFQRENKGVFVPASQLYGR